MKIREKMFSRNYIKHWLLFGCHDKAACYFFFFSLKRIRKRLKYKIQKLQTRRVCLNLTWDCKYFCTVQTTLEGSFPPYIFLCSLQQGIFPQTVLPQKNGTTLPLSCFIKMKTSVNAKEGDSSKLLRVSNICV